MQILDKRQAMSTWPLLRLGFRPFFLLGSTLAALAVPLWVFALLGDGITAQPLGGWLAWHRHELVFGFAGAIIAGFLLTAVQTWTGRPGLSGKSLGVLVVIWLAARLAWWTGSPPLLMTAILMFFACVALVMAHQLWAVRQTRNYPIVAVLVLLLGADLLTQLGLQQANDGWQRQGVWAAVWLVAAMMGLIGGRVIPFFTQRGLGRAAAVQPWAWLDWALLIVTVSLAILYASGLALQVHAWLGLVFIALAAGHGIRLLRWFDRGLLKEPLLWSLHVAYAWLAMACFGMALWHFGLLGSVSLALHAFTVGALGGLILAMLARVSLGHTGRPLVLPQGFAWAFVLLNLGSLFRVLAVSFWHQPALWLAAACWAGAFAQYLFCYAPMLWRTRADGHPG